MFNEYMNKDRGYPNTVDFTGRAGKHSTRFFPYKREKQPTCSQSSLSSSGTTSKIENYFAQSTKNRLSSRHSKTKAAQQAAEGILEDNQIPPSQ